MFGTFIQNKDRIHNTLVELNVIEQCMNIYKTGEAQCSLYGIQECN